MATLARLTGVALDVAFPAACSGCGKEGDALCSACGPALDVRLDLPGGVPIGMPADIPAPLLQIEWCAPFAGPVRSALHELKYASERRLAEPLGAAVARRWARVGIGADVIVPVPVHAERERHRGYDQAALIATVAARHLRLRVHRALERSRATTAQFELGRDQRASNVHGAFRLKPGGEHARAIRDRWVLLVDDVITTGATLAGCAAILEASGATAVSAITVARER
jgi:ComF family protein